MNTIRNLTVCIALVGTVGTSLSSRVDLRDPTTAEIETLSVMKRKVHRWDGDKLGRPTLENQSKMENPILGPLEI